VYVGNYLCQIKAVLPALWQSILAQQQQPQHPWCASSWVMVRVRAKGRVGPLQSHAARHHCVQSWKDVCCNISSVLVQEPHNSRVASFLKGRHNGCFKSHECIAAAGQKPHTCYSSPSHNTCRASSTRSALPAGTSHSLPSVS
jgi:hypothetical protein